jgi:phosphotransferase system enzyme I (PtsI)
MRTLAGVAASPGSGSGPAWVLGAIELVLPAGPVADREAEVSRLHLAQAAVADRLAGRASAASGEPADVLEAQAAMARDPELAARSAGMIRASGTPAARAVVEVGEDYARSLAASDSPYVAARAADVRDVCRDVAAEILGVSTAPAPPGPGPHVVVAHDLSPAAAVALDPAMVRAVATQDGSPVSHTAIVARALGIPAVVAVPGLLAAVSPGDRLLVDGDAGTVLLDPDAETLDRLASRPSRPAGVPATSRLGEAVTGDGRRVELAVNVGGAAELRAARALGGESVGLLRTELAYLRAAAPPSEDELAAVLADMTALLDGGRLVVRTFDFGADKLPAFMAAEGAGINPALGVRGIRLARRHPELLRALLRAVTRAAAGGGRLAVMAPMVATVEEAEWFLDVCREAGCAGAGVEIGAMVEVPAAVLCAAELADRLDFLSIGTNDLGQYLHAADRQEGSLSALQDPFQPALLRAVRQVVQAAGERAWVGVCGEAAADPLWALLAAGMGIGELSMAAADLARVHGALSGHTQAECAAAAEAALSAPDAGAARRRAADALGWRLATMGGMTIVSPMSGQVLPLDDVPDEVFSQRIAGDGLAIRPDAGEVVAPVSGRIAKLFPGGHGVVVETAEGVQVLVHVGIDTVRLRGRGFTALAREGQRVDAGDVIVRADLEALRGEGIELLSPVLVISGHRVRPAAAGRVTAGQPLLQVDSARPGP